MTPAGDVGPCLAWASGVGSGGVDTGDIFREIWEGSGWKWGKYLDKDDVLSPYFLTGKVMEIGAWLGE